LRCVTHRSLLHSDFDASANRSSSDFGRVAQVARGRVLIQRRIARRRNDGAESKMPAAEAWIFGAVLSVYTRTTHMSPSAVPLRVADRHLTTPMVITAILSEQPFAAPIPRNGPPFAGIRRPSSRTLSATGRKPAHGPRLFRFPDAGPSAWARLPSDHSSGCRFFNALQVRGQGRALNVFFLRAFAVDAQRWVRRILNPSRRSFKLRVLVDRQRPMKNVSFDRTTVLQLYTRRTDGALNAAADCDILGNHAAIDRRAIADQEIGSAQLAFNSAEDLSRTIAFDLADDRHVEADARVTAPPPRATSNSRRAMVTAMRPARARCVKGRIPWHERAVLPRGRGQSARRAYATGHRPAHDFCFSVAKDRARGSRTPESGRKHLLTPAAEVLE